MHLKLILALLLLCVNPTLTYEEEDHVIVLTEENFDTVVQETDLILVEFYAPWCGHCKALAPEYAEAAKTLFEEKSPVRLAKIDATVNPGVAQKFEVKGYPTLKWFNNGKPTEYNGGRKSANIVDWVKKKSGPVATAISTVDQLEQFLQGSEVSVVGYFKGDSSASDIFMQVAAESDDITFATISDENVAKSMKVTNEGIVMHHRETTPETSDASPRLNSEDIVSSDDLKKWIHAYKFSEVTEFTQDTAGKVFAGPITNHHFLIVGKSNPKYDELITKFRAAAKQFRTRIIFILLDIDVEENERILDFFGVKKVETPTSRIVLMGDDLTKYKALEGQDFVSFSQAYLDGTAQVDLKSQDVEEGWDKNPVKVLVGKNFNEVALDESKFVFVKFYAPWCGHCKQIAPIWDQLGEAFAGSDDVIIAKLDGTANEVEGVAITSFPTLRLYPAGSGKPIDFKGDRKLEALTEFVNEHTGKKSSDDVPEATEVPHEEL